jgi:hypothetical protein
LTVTTIAKEELMEAQCRCGAEFRFSFDQLGCIECGSSCCPSCSYQLESANYCSRCAETLLELPWAVSAHPSGAHAAGLV